MLNLLLGANFGYDAWPNSPDEAFNLFRILRPRQVTMMSHAALYDYERVLHEHRHLKLWHVRCKTGPQNTGAYPHPIIDYKEWPTERSAGDAIEFLLSNGIVVNLVLGNEPPLELVYKENEDSPIDHPIYMPEAQRFYVNWFQDQIDFIRSRWTADQVKIAMAPLSQGNPAIFESWWEAFKPYMHKADFKVGHLYTKGRPFDDPDWGGQFVTLAAHEPQLPLDILEMNDDGVLYDSLVPSYARGEHYGHYINFLDAHNVARSLSIFKLPGGPDHKPWWSINELMAEAIRDTVYFEPQPQPQPEEPVVTIEDMFLARWRMNVPDAEYVHNNGIEKAWREHPEWGSPIVYMTEIPIEYQGGTYNARLFANAVVIWRNGAEVITDVS